MHILSKLYRKVLIHRYDDRGYPFYFSATDFLTNLDLHDLYPLFNVSVAIHNEVSIPKEPQEQFLRVIEVAQAEDPHTTGFFSGINLPAEIFRSHDPMTKRIHD